MNASGSVGSTLALASTHWTPKGARTRQRIVETAATLMYQQGVARTTMEDVRAAARVSSSQLYHYFVDKQALVRAVIAHQIDLIVGSEERADLATLDGLRAWKQRVVEYVRQLHAFSGCPLGSLGSELADTDPVARIDIANGFDRWEGVFRRSLRSMQERGALNPAADVERLALALLAALQGGLLLAQIQRDVKPLDTALSAMLSLVEGQSAPEVGQSSRL